MNNPVQEEQAMKVVILWGIEDSGVFNRICLQQESSGPNVLKDIDVDLLFRSSGEIGEILGAIEQQIKEKFPDVEVAFEHDPFVGGCPL